MEAAAQERKASPAPHPHQMHPRATLQQSINTEAEVVVVVVVVVVVEGVVMVEMGEGWGVEEGWGVRGWNAKGRKKTQTVHNIHTTRCIMANWNLGLAGLVISTERERERGKEGGKKERGGRKGERGEKNIPLPSQNLLLWDLENSCFSCWVLRKATLESETSLSASWTANCWQMNS